MKDLAHHLKKLNRRIIRSMHREELENEKFEEEPPRKQTPQEMKKIKKKSILFIQIPNIVYLPLQNGTKIGRKMVGRRLLEVMWTILS